MRRLTLVATALAVVGLVFSGVALVGAAPPGSATVANTGLAVISSAALDSGLVAVVVSEADQAATDLNGDGDTGDYVVHVFDPATETAINTGLASFAVTAVGPRVAFNVDEASQAGTDLNGDGDTADSVAHVFDPATGTSVNTGLGSSSLRAVGDRLALTVSEDDQGATDLNGDGDTGDFVVHVFDPATGTATNTGLASFFVAAVGDRVAFDVFEAGQGATDLNGDGDTGDFVVHVFDPATGTATNSGLAWAGGAFVAVDGRVAFTVSEADQGATDLNGDGDTGDEVIHVFDPATGTATNTDLAVGFSGVAAVGEQVAFSVPEGDQAAIDLNGDGDTSDEVIHVFDPATGTATNTGLASGSVGLRPVGDRLALTVSEGDQGATDLNGDGDTGDEVIHVFDPATGTATNTDLAATGWFAEVGDRVAFFVYEGDQGAIDLNGDGDTGDYVVHVVDPAGSAMNSGLAADVLGIFRAAGDQVVLMVPEPSQGFSDLNGDGDTGDSVVHVFDPIAATAINLELALDAGFPGIDVKGRVAALLVPEGVQGPTDLNGDGDTTDQVAHVVTLNTAPVAVADTATVAEGDTLSVSGILDNDTDREGDDKTAIKATDPAHGTLTLSPNGSYTYTHDGSETTSDSFTYRAWDGELESDPATVAITIIPVNDPPVAVDDTTTVAEGATVAGNVLTNDIDAEMDPLTAQKLTDPAHGALTLGADGSYTYTHDGSETTSDSFTYRASDGMLESDLATVTITIITPGHSVGLVDPTQGRWHLRDADNGTVAPFFYGNPGDVPFMGDWDCDGIDTPGLYRQSDGFAYLRNANTEGVADISFFFGNPGDIPIAGDFNGDGCDTVSIYRSSEQRFYVINALGTDGGGLGAADFSFAFGNPGDAPVTGDWDGDGVTEVGLFRESAGFFYFRFTLTTGIADDQFFFGDPGDRFVGGDWGVVDDKDSPAVFRGSAATFFFKHTLVTGVADSELEFGRNGWLPVAGQFGP